jgi:hypothetical protein
LAAAAAARYADDWAKRFALRSIGGQGDNHGCTATGTWRKWVFLPLPGHETVAEGVEDGDVLKMLQEFDVDFAQGFHLGRPAEL